MVVSNSLGVNAVRASRLLSLILFCIILDFASLPTTIFAVVQKAWADQSPRVQTETCPTTLKELVAELLPELPSYANRVRIRAGIAKSYVMLAARPEFQPLPLSTIAALPQQSTDTSVQQVFFTTLIRSHERDRLTHVQEYHWLFLTQPHPGDWRVVSLYSILGPYPAGETIPLAPRNSSEGSIAQAVRDWLLTCRSRT